MQTTKITKIILSVLAVVILLGIYIAFDLRTKKSTDSPVTDNQTVSTTTTGSDIGLDIGGTGNYVVKPIPITPPAPKPVPVPDLSRAVIFDPKISFDQSTKSAISDKITNIQSELKKDSTKLLYWIDLGMYQKMAGDYVGAALSWKYVNQVAQGDFVSTGNLGDLYAYYIKDSAQAEMYFKLAISRDPKQIYLYTQLADFYKNVLKDMDKAKAIISQGLSKNPSNPALLQYQSTLTQ